MVCGTAKLPYFFHLHSAEAEIRPGGGGDAGTIYFHLHKSFGGKTGCVEKQKIYTISFIRCDLLHSIILLLNTEAWRRCFMVPKP